MSSSRPIEKQFAPSFHAIRDARRREDAEPDTAREAQALLEDAVAARASDLHIDPHREDFRLRFRVDGSLHDVGRLTRSAGERLLRHLQTAAEMTLLHPFEPQDGHLHREIGGEPWELRLSMAPTVSGDKLAVRLLSGERLERRIGELGMAPHTHELFEQWLGESIGMGLVVGPTGCGKTTTLYAILHELKDRARSVVTIEDPVEYELDGIVQLSVNDDAGLTFATGLKAMLRLDPDYLMVGELRDEESADAAIDAAGAGHLLMATLHSRDAIGAVTMLRNYGIDDHKIAAALELVVAQRLVRRLCKKCRQRVKPTDAEGAWLQRHGLEVPRRSWSAEGCEACSQTGYHGRLGTFELWRIDKEFETLILNGADEIALRRKYLSRSNPVLLQDGLAKADAGETSLAELQSMGAGTQGYLLRQGEDRQSE